MTSLCLTDPFILLITSKRLNDRVIAPITAQVVSYHATDLMVYPGPWFICTDYPGFPISY